MTISLSEYLDKSSTRKTPSCAVCALPKDILDQVNAALRESPNHTAIGRWLRDVVQIDVTPTPYHYRAGHHLLEGE